MTAICDSSSPLQLMAWQELLRHRWIESEKARQDLGERAYRDWCKKYWHQWLRARIMEHLSGDRFWEELDRKDYGLLKREFHPNKDLLNQIVDQIKEGKENLCIINWAIDSGQQVGECIAILRKIDINNRRLSFYRFLQ